MSEIPSEIMVPARMLERQRGVLVAHVAGAGRRRVHRRVAVAAAAVLLLAAMVAAPALGLGSRLAELFEGTPAPPPIPELFAANDEVRKRFAAERDDRYSRVLAEEARGVISLETTDGTLRLWAAPTEDGRQCFLLEHELPPGGRVYGHGACDPLNAEGMPASSLWVAPLWSVTLVHIRVHEDEIVEVDVQVENGGVVQLPVVVGHAFGALGRGARVDDVVGRNAAGDEVARIKRD